MYSKPSTVVIKDDGWSDRFDRFIVLSLDTLGWCCSYVVPSEDLSLTPYKQNRRQNGDDVNSTKQPRSASVSTKNSDTMDDNDTSTVAIHGTAHWMELVAQRNPSITLRELIIPGSHNSGTYTINPRSPLLQPIVSIARTQNYTITQQLEAGIRYLDIRVATSSSSSLMIPTILHSPPKKVADEKSESSNISIWHGCIEGCSFEEVLDEVKVFCDTHNECIIIEITPEFGRYFPGSSKHKCLETIVSMLPPEYVIPASHVNDVIQTIPLSTVLSTTSYPSESTVSPTISLETTSLLPNRSNTTAAKGKVILLLHNRFFENSSKKDKDDDMLTEDEVLYDTNDYFNIHTNYLCNPWHKNIPNDIDALLQKNVDTFHRIYKFQNLICNQILISPKVSSAGDVLDLLRGTVSLYPISWSKQLYRHGCFNNFLRTHAAKSWNILSLDYINLCPDIIDFIISLNFNYLAFTFPRKIPNPVLPSTSTIQNTMKVHIAVVEPQQICKPTVHGSDGITQPQKIIDPDVLNQIIYRNCALYITDPIEDLQIEEYCNKLKSSYGKKVMATLTIGFSTTITLSAEAAAIQQTESVSENEDDIHSSIQHDDDKGKENENNDDDDDDSTHHGSTGPLRSYKTITTYHVATIPFCCDNSNPCPIILSPFFPTRNHEEYNIVSLNDADIGAGVIVQGPNKLYNPVGGIITLDDASYGTCLRCIRDEDNADEPFERYKFEIMQEETVRILRLPTWNESP